MHEPLTPKQTEAVGNIMAKAWGCHAQTGHLLEPSDVIVLFTKMGPNFPAVKHLIHPDGTVDEKFIEWDGREDYAADKG